MGELGCHLIDVTRGSLHVNEERCDEWKQIKRDITGKVKLLSTAADVRALLVVTRHLSAPRVIGQRDNRVSQIERDNPGREIPNSGRRWRQK